MSDEIPFATLTSPTMVDERQRRLRKRKFVGSGIAVLKKQTKNVILGSLGKTILSSLIYQHGIEINEELQVDNIDTVQFEEGFVGGQQQHQHQQQHLTNKDHEPNRNDDHTNNNNTDPTSSSFFVALLKAVIGGNDGGGNGGSFSPVSARHILTKVCLSLHPGNLPGMMDSKDIVLASLNFLSMYFSSQAPHILLKLPLIRSEKAYGDLERRNYIKVGDWRLTESFKQKLIHLEKLFFGSSSSWKWQKRKSFSIRLSDEDEEALFMKGTIPLRATYKKIKGGGGGGEASKKMKATETETTTIQKSEKGTDSFKLDCVG